MLNLKNHQQKKRIIVYRNRKLKFYLSLIILVTLSLSLFLFVKYYIEKNPIQIESSSSIIIDNNQLPTTVLGFSNNATNASLDIASTLNNTFSPSTSDPNLFFLIKKENIEFISIFDGLNFKDFYQTENQIEIINLFQNQKALVIESNKLNYVLKVVSEDYIEEIHKFDVGEIPVDVALESEYGRIYAIVSDINGSNSIYMLTSNSKLNKITDLNITGEVEFLNINGLSQTLYYKDKNKCYSFSIESKIQTEEICDFIKIESSKYTPIKNSDSFELVNTEKMTSQNISILESINTVKDFFIGDNTFYYLSFIENSVLKFNIFSKNIETNQETKLISNIKFSDSIREFLKYKDSFYFLTKDSIYKIVEKDISESIVNEKVITKDENRIYESLEIELPYFDILSIELLNSVNF